MSLVSELQPTGHERLGGWVEGSGVSFKVKLPLHTHTHTHTHIPTPRGSLRPQSKYHNYREGQKCLGSILCSPCRSLRPSDGSFGPDCEAWRRGKIGVCVILFNYPLLLYHTHLDEFSLADFTTLLVDFCSNKTVSESVKEANSLIARG